jgi:hypothetical protein
MISCLPAGCGLAREDACTSARAGSSAPQAYTHDRGARSVHGLVGAGGQTAPISAEKTEKSMNIRLLRED